MQQLPASAPTTAAPSFWNVVIGTVIGSIGCLLVYFLLSLCLLIPLLAILGPQIANIFSRVTNGLGAP